MGFDATNHQRALRAAENITAGAAGAEYVVLSSAEIVLAKASPLTDTSPQDRLKKGRPSTMPRLSNRELNLRPSGGERVFTDAFGQLWSAATHVDDNGVTVVFTCINDGRQSGRAIVIELKEEVGDVGDETLRAWLEAAPRIGRLT